MRVATRTASLVIRRLHLLAPATSAVLLLFLGACEADTPMVAGDRGGSPLVVRFPVAPGEAQPAAMATNQVVRRLPTLQAATAARTPETASGSQTDSPLTARSWRPRGDRGDVVQPLRQLLRRADRLLGDWLNIPGHVPARSQRESPARSRQPDLNEDVPGKFAVTERQGTVALASSTATLNDISALSTRRRTSPARVAIPTFPRVPAARHRHVHHGIPTATRPTTRRRGPSVRSTAAWISARANTSCTPCNPTSRSRLCHAQSNRA